MPTPMPPPPGLSDSPEHMQHWLRAKAEDDRRSQEEEKTRQEALKLEQRKIEQAILADSLRAGVPPDVLPLLFASMNGNGGFVPFQPQDMAQQWTRSGATHVQASSRSPRSHIHGTLPGPGISTTLPPLAQHLQTAPAGPQRDLPATNPTLYTSSTPNIPPGTGNITTHLPPSHSATAGVLKPVGRARAIDVSTQVQTTPSFPSTPPVNVSQQQQTTAIRGEPTSRSSPSISFHHWVPPQAPASVPADGQVQSGRKRKSSYPHHHHPPPPRSLDTPAGTTLNDRNGSIGEAQVSPRSQRRLDLRDLSSSYESGEGEYLTPAEPHAGALLNRKELQRSEGMKQEQERSSHREAQHRPLSTSDIENLSTPSLTGASSKSGGNCQF
ncbi:Phosphopantothenoylcysteine decarboxylase [Penicillium atrosanguineum]|uniref:Phosphopantothenoylcysteine decarboxylase n=1 Tax=Penicillium atrosanguineum TaxID=1132637 RepID=UPI00238596C0|nr:Phosphopantothenoylcysteine decarboxylase [Penicillium atrosanguineum]KAJ5141288.1 hypothetical protein N7526_002283 [Penicillium atrosanguineum]KAJ5290489.1 Phosphopantothenoylcysteine decarboxylase [Penicillium atrosanguineum]